MLTNNKGNAKLLIGADDQISKNYLKSMQRILNQEIKNGSEKIIILPREFINKTRTKQYKSRLPTIMLYVAGIGKGIGWLAYNKEGALEMNTSLKYASDYEYIRRCKAKRYSLKHAKCSYTHNKQGRSSNSLIAGILEEHKIAVENRESFIILGWAATTIFLSIKAAARIILHSIKLIKSIRSRHKRDK